MFKKFFTIIFFGLLFFLAQDSYAVVGPVRLDSLTPNSAVPNTQVTAIGYSLCSNTKVVFRNPQVSSFGTEVSATALDCDTRSSPQTANSFRFTVPSNLTPATYQVTLKRVEGSQFKESSEQKDFVVEAVALEHLTLAPPSPGGTTNAGLNPRLSWTYRFTYCHSGTYNCSAPRFQWILKEAGQVVASNTITNTSVTLSSSVLGSYNGGKLKPSTPYNWEVNLFLVVLADGHLESLKRQEASFTTMASTAPPTPTPPAPTPGQLPAPINLSCFISDGTTRCPSSGIEVSQFPINLKWNWDAAYNEGLGASGVWLEAKNKSNNQQIISEWGAAVDTPMDSRRVYEGDVSVGATYEWRVKACKEQGSADADCSPWATQTFAVKQTSAAPPPGGGTTPPPGGGTTPPPAPVVCGECAPGQICNPLQFCEFDQLIDAIINFIFWVGMAVAPVMFIVAGLLFITSAGDPNRVQGAKKMMLYTVLGLVTLLFAKGLIKVLQSILGWTG